MDRRTFIGVTAGTLGFAALPGCASLAVLRLAPQDGTLRLPLRNYPQLQHPGGYLKVLPEGAATPLYILAGERHTYTVLSPICTHLGCTVNVEGAHLVCPCHGSTYDRSGAVVRGPAQRSLRQYAAVVTEEEELVIRLDAEDA